MQIKHLFYNRNNNSKIKSFVNTKLTTNKVCNNPIKFKFMKALVFSNYLSPNKKS